MSSDDTKVIESTRVCRKGRHALGTDTRLAAGPNRDVKHDHPVYSSDDPTLDRVIAKLASLPPEEQDRVARWLLDELRDDEQWTRCE